MRSLANTNTMYGKSFELRPPDDVALKPYPKLIVSETADRSVRQILSKTDHYPSLQIKPTAENIHAQLLARWPLLGFDLIGVPNEIINLDDAKLYQWLDKRADQWEATDNIAVSEVAIADPKYPNEKHEYLPLGINQKYAAAFLIEGGDPVTYSLMVYDFATEKWKNTCLQYDHYAGATIENGGDRLFIVANGRVICVKLGPKKPRQMWTTMRLINSKVLSVLSASFGKVYVGAFDQEEVVVLNAESGALQQRIETPVQSIASCDRLFACGTDTGRLRVYTEEDEHTTRKPEIKDTETGERTIVLEEKTIKKKLYRLAMNELYMKEYESVSGIQIKIPTAPVLSLSLHNDKLVVTGPGGIIMEEKNPQMPHLLALDNVGTVICNHIVGDYVLTLSENGAITIGLFGDATDIYQLTPEAGKQKYFYGQRYVSGTWMQFHALLPNGNILIFKPK